MTVSLRNIKAPQINAMAMIKRFYIKLTAYQQEFWTCLIVIICLGYFAIACLLAARKPLWYDEILTYHLVRLPDFATFWRALASGPDLSPPLYHICVRTLRPLFGDGPVALRLPAIFGFGVMVLCLFRFAIRRGSSYAALAALFLPFVSSAFRYAIEARPYGLVLGAGGIALVCWQAAAEGERRRLALVGLALGLAAGICSHYYAVLLFFPLALGELVRTISRRRIDLPIWGAFALGAAPIALLLPLIANARGRIPDFWSKPRKGNLTEFYPWLFPNNPTIFLVLSGVVLVYLYRRNRPDSPPAAVESRRSFPLHEVVAITVFVLFPTLGYFLAVFATGAFVQRYCLPAIMGISLLAAILVDRQTWSWTAKAAVGVIFLGWLAFVQFDFYREVSRDRNAYDELRQALGSDRDGCPPILVADPLRYVEVHHTAPEQFARHVFFAKNKPGSSIYQPAELELGLLDRWVPLNLTDLRTFQSSHAEFLVFGKPESGLIATLQKDKSEVVIAQKPNLTLIKRVN